MPLPGSQAKAEVAGHTLHVLPNPAHFRDHMGQLCLARKPTPIWHLHLHPAPRTGYLWTDTYNLGHHMSHTSLDRVAGRQCCPTGCRAKSPLPSAEKTQRCDPALLCAAHSHSSWAQQACSALTRSSLYFGLLDSSFVRLKKAERELGKGRAEEMVTDIKHTFLQQMILIYSCCGGTENIPNHSSPGTWFSPKVTLSKLQVITRLPPHTGGDASMSTDP